MGTCTVSLRREVQFQVVQLERVVPSCEKRKVGLYVVKCREGVISQGHPTRI